MYQLLRMLGKTCNLGSHILFPFFQGPRKGRKKNKKKTKKNQKTPTIFKTSTFFSSSKIINIVIN